MQRIPLHALLYLLVQDPDSICDETVSDPSFSETSMSRIDKDPDFSWFFAVRLKVQSVTLGKTFVIPDWQLAIFQ